MFKPLVNDHEGTKRFNGFKGIVMEFFLGLPKIVKKAHIIILVVVGCCIHKLTRVTSGKVSTL